MRSRRFLSIAGIAALAAMLFAQAAVALAACHAFRTQSHASMIAAQQDDSAWCHEPDQNANLCLANCQTDDQTLDKHEIKVPSVVLQPVLLLGNPPQADTWPARRSMRLRAPAAGPPPRILFQSFLI